GRGWRVGGLWPCPCLCACPCPSACRWPRRSASKPDREARDRRANVRSRRVVERGWLKWRRESRWTTRMGWTAGACSSADSHKPYRDGPPSNYRGQYQRFPSQPQLAYIALSFASAARISVSWCLGSLLFFVSFGHIHINVTLTVLRVGVKLTKKI